MHIQRAGGGRDIAIMLGQHPLDVLPGETGAPTWCILGRVLRRVGLALLKRGQDVIYPAGLARYCAAPSLMASTAVAMLA